ncbi:MAG: EAL domain-containing protein [Burkholderiales bacterium]
MREVLRPFLTCRLCWRITVAVFLLILAVEIAILIPSTRTFASAERARIAERAQIQVDAKLEQAGDRPQAAVSGVVGKLGVRGVALYDETGARLAADGEAPPFPAGSLDARAVTFDDPESAMTLISAWRFQGDPVVRVAVRSDSSQIVDSVRAYQWRIAGLVAIIVLVVTLGTMIVVYLAVLRPVLRLRRSSQLAGEEPAAAERHRLPTHRHDEIGQLIDAHNAMLGKISESARFVARHDPLSGLPNRAALTEFLDRESEGAGATLFLANLVQFRAINAGYGTSLGDRVIHGLASRLKAAALPGDFLAHLGADRLALVRSRVLAPQEAVAIAEELVRQLAAPFEFAGGVSVSPEVRIGIAQSSVDAREGQTLLAQADLALARAYDSEEAKYQFFSPALAAESRARQSLSRDLERALQVGELTVALQPKFRLARSDPLTLEGAEILLRWHHPQRGWVSPAEFIPIAEASGLIVPIGEFVLTSACALSAGWRTRFGRAPRLAVNLSARQFVEANLLERSGEIIARAGIPAEAIEFEITETAAMRDVTRTAQTLAALRELGVHVSIDDFGTGYSSLNYLRRFAVDAIKIDKSFVDDIGSDRNAEAICDAVLRLGQSLGTRVIAEGVENTVQQEFLLQRRCDEVQGYLYGRPVPAAEFEKLHLADWVPA